MWRRTLLVAVPLIAIIVAGCATGPRSSLGPLELIGAPGSTAPAAAATAIPRVGVARSATVEKAPVRIAFGGDVHGEPPIKQLLASGDDVLAGVRPAFADADAVMVNLETTVSDKGEPLP